MFITVVFPGLVAVPFCCRFPCGPVGFRFMYNRYPKRITHVPKLKKHARDIATIGSIMLLNAFSLPRPNVAPFIVLTTDLLL